VLGHTKCETVATAAENDSVSMPMKTIINNIGPAIAKVKKENKGLAGDELAAKAIAVNVWQSIDDIFKRSAAVRSFVNTGRLKVVGAIYDIETGKVHLLGVHLRQDFLLKKYSQKTGNQRVAEKKIKKL
jgi:carbonic anhydrase